ncbi:MAG: nucleotide exchange factor GrpE [Chloroflexi bacterium]|nr:nucleotide exchange factor GrpE [Chloroflexota bacterium]
MSHPHEETGSEPEQSPTATEESTPEPAEASLESRLAEAESKRDEYLDLLKRARADFTNFRRRMDEERSQRALDANRDLVLRLLPIVDDLARALSQAQPDELESPWGKGVLLIERNLRALLASEDVQPIEALGTEFNPWEHEALAHQPTADADEGTVVQVVRSGYRRGERILRPAQVIVARRPD